jgi:hypothetical protein
MAKVIDFEAFYKKLDSVRRQRRLTWNKVATRAGVSTSSLATMVRSYEVDASEPKRLHLDNFIALCDWMGEYDLRMFTQDEADL